MSSTRVIEKVHAGLVIVAFTTLLYNHRKYFKLFLTVCVAGASLAVYTNAQAM